MNQIMDAGFFNIWKRDMQKTTGLDRKVRGNACNKVNQLLRESSKDYGIQCRDAEIEDALAGGLATALEMGTVIRVQRNDTSLNPESRFDKPKIALLYKSFQTDIKKELMSVKPSANGAKPPHTDEFVAIVKAWKDKAHEGSNTSLFAMPSNAALSAPAPATFAPPGSTPSAPAPLIRNRVQGPSMFSMVPPSTSSTLDTGVASAPAPPTTSALPVRTVVQGPMNINMVTLASSSTFGTLTGLGASSHAPAPVAAANANAGDDSMEVDQAMSNSTTHVTAPSASTAAAADSDGDVEMESDSTPPVSSSTAINAPVQMGPAPSAAVQDFPSLPLRCSPSPEILLVFEDTRQQSMELFLNQLNAKNAEEAARCMERLSPAEVPECAQMMECNILHAMAADIRINTGEWKQPEVEKQYCDLVNKKLDDRGVFATFVKKVKQFHKLVMKGIVKVKGLLPRKRHGFTSLAPPPTSLPTPPPAPLMGSLRDQFKELMFKALMETGERVLSSEHMPQLNLTKAEVEDLVIQLEAEMFGELDNKYRDANLGIEGSCRKYVTEGTARLEKIRAATCLCTLSRSIRAFLEA